MKKQNIKTRNYGQFFALLKQMPTHMSQEEWHRQWVWEYTNGRTNSLQQMMELKMHIEYSLMIGAMRVYLEENNPEFKKMDALRKRVLKIIGLATGREGDIKYIKSIALRSAGKEYSDFNKISASRLNGLGFYRWRLHLNP